MNTSARRLLVVDDEPFNLEIIAEHLEGDHYDIVTAGDGEEAWSILKEASGEDFDALILDRMMPKLDGLELLKRVKQEARFRHLPVIMQTAAAAKEQVLEGIRNGAYYYLTKPFDGEVLATVVRAAVVDRVAWQEMAQAAAVEPQALRLLTDAQFRFQTLAEARHLAAALATCLPDRPNAGLGLLEMFVNAVEHGNLGIALEEKAALLKAGRWEAEVGRRLALPEHRDKWVQVHYRHAGDAITVHVRDDGPGFDWRAYLDFDPRRAFEPNGRGIALARQLCFPDLEYIGSGNEVRITVRLAG